MEQDHSQTSTLLLKLLVWDDAQFYDSDLLVILDKTFKVIWNAELHRKLAFESERRQINQSISNCSDRYGAALFNILGLLLCFKRVARRHTWDWCWYLIPSQTVHTKVWIMSLRKIVLGQPQHVKISIRSTDDKRRESQENAIEWVQDILARKDSEPRWWGESSQEKIFKALSKCQ